MNPIFIAAAIPVFFLLIGVELWLARRQGRHVYDYADSIADLSCGVAQQVTLVLLKGALLFGYYLLWERARLFDLPANRWWSWALLLVALDCGYYWAHRVSHRVNFVWAGHVVHHQSEEFNLAVALRQSVVQGLFEAPFYLPLALLGFPPLMFIGAKTINTLYQFWIHTRLVGRLGPLEWVLNTPSHHRVHHGINPKYIDKNYAGMFIVWDRLFGTFQVEQEEPAYGTVKPIASFNPVWAQVERWVGLAQMTAATKRLRDKVAVWLAPPDWRPADLGGPVEIPEQTRDTQALYRVKTGRGATRYVTASFALAAVATGALILYADRLPVAERIAAVVLVLAAMAVWGGLLEQRRWAMPLELGRLAATAVLGAWLARGTPFFVAVAAGGAAAATVLGLWLARSAVDPAPPPPAPASRAPA